VDPFLLLMPDEATPRVPCPVLGSLAQERSELTGESPEKGHKDDEGTGESLLQGKAEEAGTAQPREVVAQRGSCQCVIHT